MCLIQYRRQQSWLSWLSIIATRTSLRATAATNARISSILVLSSLDQCSCVGCVCTCALTCINKEPTDTCRSAEKHVLLINWCIPDFTTESWVLRLTSIQYADVCWLMPTYFPSIIFCILHTRPSHRSLTFHNIQRSNARAERRTGERCYIYIFVYTFSY